MLILYLKTSLCEVEVGWGYEEEKHSGPDKKFLTRYMYKTLTFVQSHWPKALYEHIFVKR